MPARASAGHAMTPWARQRALWRGAQASQTLADRAQGSQLRQIEENGWGPHQDEFLRCNAREKLLRTGNQSGKTLAGLAEAIYRCQGAHPYLDVAPPPVEGWVVCASWAQSIAIQKKFYALVPKEWLHPSVKFDEAKGFRGKNPVVRFKNGSILRFKTTRQGALNLASDTIDFVLIDELTTPRVYTELRKRVMRKKGYVLLTITPINAPSAWLQDQCAKGAEDPKKGIVDMHHRFTPELFRSVKTGRVFRFPDGEPMDDAWVAEEIERTAEDERDVVCHGEWPSGDIAREMRGFSSANVKTDADLAKRKPIFTLYGLGLDHGEKSGREVVLLTAWEPKNSALWVLGEYVSVGTTSLEDDAAGVGELLHEWSLKLTDVSVAAGDVNSAGKAANGMTVNEYFEGLFAAANGGRQPFAITPAQKGAGSVDDRTIMLNSALAGRRIVIHESCVRLLKALRTWKGQNNREKDPIDALGYIFTEFMPLHGRQARKARMSKRRGRRAA